MTSSKTIVVFCICICEHSPVSLTRFLFALFLILLEPKPARYLPESFILERGLKTDTQVLEATKILASEKRFDKVLGIDTKKPKPEPMSMELASSNNVHDGKSQAAFRVSF